MKQKIVVLTLLLAVGFSFSECDNCSCPEVDGTHYNILGLKSLEHFGKTNGEVANISEGDMVDFENYRGLSLIFNSEFTFGQKNKKSTPFNFSLINTAYGCSCLFNGIDGSLQKIETLNIITINDFDSTHLANDTINEYFQMDFYGLSVDEFLSSTEEKRIYANNIYDDVENELQFQLLLQQQPVLDSVFQVKVELELDNGTVYSMESNQVIFM